MEEISTGVEKTLKIKKLHVCDSCNGSGAKDSSSKATCHTCNGQGEIRQVSRSVFGQFVNISACPTCNGSGKVIKDKCNKCHGDGRVSGEEKVTVTIPAGVEEGNYLPMKGKGNAGKDGGPAGDLIVIMQEKQHDVFKRKGNDVYYELKISFPEAALGTNIDVPTLIGSENIKIDSGTQPGTAIKLKDKGIPNLNGYGKGDQIVILNVYIPNKLSANDKELLHELAKSENMNPNNKHNKKDKDFFDKLKDAIF